MSAGVIQFRCLETLFFFFFHKLNETLGFDIYGNVFIKMKTGMESEADSQEENVDKLQR